jgi:regulator of sigma E protease
VESIVGTVLEGSPADKAGFLVGDKILSMDNVNVSDFNDLRRYIALRGDTDILTEIYRNEARIELIIKPERKFEKDLIGGNIRNRKNRYRSIRASGNYPIRI